MSKTKVNVTFDKKERPNINGEESRRHYDGNNGRTVYITPHFVLKVDDRGYHHDDLAAWKRIEKKDRKYFVPVLAQGQHDGIDWSIQPFVDLDTNFTDEAKDIVAHLEEKYSLDDLTIFYDTPRNWAMHKGQPVIFDYGLGASSS